MALAEWTGKRASNINQLFGLSLWTELDSRSPIRSPEWKSSLQSLNTARNAIAHDDRGALARLEANGFRLTRIETMKKFHRHAGQLAKTMDDVLAVHIQQLFGGAKPW